MPRDFRFVLDTNVTVSALLLRQSLPRQAFEKALGNGKLLISTATVYELNDVLLRKSLDKYILEEERAEFLAALVREAILLEPDTRVSECRDPEDNKFLELAISGQAACIVSGDNDLLVLNPFRGISILTPRQFLEFEWTV